MQTIYFKKLNELRKNKLQLEKKLNTKITIIGRQVTLTSKNPLDEYEASIVLNAMNFGFSAKKALQIKEQEMLFRVINIKHFTRKKNLNEVRARIIGTKGKTKRTIENISNCHILIKDNEVGIIGNAEDIEEIITGVTNLIRGTKQSNTYRYLEKMNRRKNTKDYN